MATVKDYSGALPDPVKVPKEMLLEAGYHLAMNSVPAGAFHLCQEEGPIVWWMSVTPSSASYHHHDCGSLLRRYGWWERQQDRNMYSWEQLSWHIVKSYIFYDKKYLPRFIKQIVPTLGTMSLAATVWPALTIWTWESGSFRRMQKFSCLAKWYPG